MILIRSIGVELNNNMPFRKKTKYTYLLKYLTWGSVSCLLMEKYKVLKFPFGYTDNKLKSLKHVITHVSADIMSETSIRFTLNIWRSLHTSSIFLGFFNKNN